MVSADRDGKDVVADILPPPEYIVESYLTALQIVDALESGRTAEVTSRIERLEKLRAEYDSRHEYWEKNLTETELRQLLLTNPIDPRWPSTTKPETRLFRFAVKAT